jgi:hypothetical protein
MEKREVGADSLGAKAARASTCPSGKVDALVKMRHRRRFHRDGMTRLIGAIAKGGTARLRRAEGRRTAAASPMSLPALSIEPDGYRRGWPRRRNGGTIFA